MRGFHGWWIALHEPVLHSLGSGLSRRALPVLLVLALFNDGGVAVASERRPPGKSEDAVRIARGSVGRMTLGKVTVKQQGADAPRTRAELLVDGVVVARLRVDNRTGRFLAGDERPAPGPGLEPSALKVALEQAVRRLAIGEWAWPSEGGQTWGVPLLFEGRTVGRLRVDAQKGLVARVREPE